MKLIFLDTETTGFSSKDEIVQLSFLSYDCDTKEVEFYSEYCKPQEAIITPESMSIHHITPEKVKDCPPVHMTNAWEELLKLNTENNTLIAHNVGFDLRMLGYAGFKNEMFVIDTLKIAKKHLKEAKKHNLQYLRYYLNLYKSEKELMPEKFASVELSAHDAMSDVLFCFCLFFYFVTQLNLNLQQMVDDTESHILLNKIEFGKHKGLTWEEVAIQNPNYLIWMDKNKIKYEDPDIKYTVKYYLQRRKK